jgi:FUN14 domain-containing protein 1
MGRESDYSVKKVLKDLSKASPSKQMAVGAGSGWLAGFLTMKAGKSFATAIGGSILLLQVLNHVVVANLYKAATL